MPLAPAKVGIHADDGIAPNADVAMNGDLQGG